MPDNYERMIALITEFFDTKNDPDQISVTEADREKLLAIHPATMSELANEDGPIVWILLVPTTQTIMDHVIKGELSEQKLLDETKPGDVYEAIYLCSGFVLPEYRNNGLAKKVGLDAIRSICKDHPIRSLFYWPFSTEGKALAEGAAKELGLQLFEKK